VDQKLPAGQVCFDRIHWRTMSDEKDRGAVKRRMVFHRKMLLEHFMKILLRDTSNKEHN
jgi:hypothetical protein